MFLEVTCFCQYLFFKFFNVFDHLKMFCKRNSLNFCGFYFFNALPTRQQEKVQFKVLIQGKLIAVVYTLRTF